MTYKITKRTRLSAGRVYPNATRREGRRYLLMPKCGACGWEFSERTLVKHGEVCEDDIKAGAKPYEPAVNDIIREIEERLGEDIH